MTLGWEERNKRNHSRREQGDNPKAWRCRGGAGGRLLSRRGEEGGFRWKGPAQTRERKGEVGSNGRDHEGWGWGGVEWGMV